MAMARFGTTCTPRMPSFCVPFWLVLSGCTAVLSDLLSCATPRSGTTLSPTRRISCSRVSILPASARARTLLRTLMDGESNFANLWTKIQANYFLNRDIYRSDNIVIQDSVINNGDGT
jgi:hypothetical protein